MISEALDNSYLLHLVADNSHIGTIGLLFGKGASIDKKDNTLLHCAAVCGYTDTVRILLDKGTPIQALNTDYQSPLHLAAMNGHTGIVDILLGKGASFEAMSRNESFSGSECPLYRVVLSSELVR